MKEKVEEFAVLLVAQSLRIANAKQADVISAAYVDQASRQLFTDRFARRSKLREVLGGIFLGAGLSMMFGMLVEGKLSPRGSTISFVLAVVGTFTVRLQRDD